MLCTYNTVDPAREEAKALLSKLKLEAEGLDDQEETKGGGERQVIIMAKAGDR